MYILEFINKGSSKTKKAKNSKVVERKINDFLDHNGLCVTENINHPDGTIEYYCNDYSRVKIRSVNV